MSDDMLTPLDEATAPTGAARPASELRAFLIADIRGYTAFTQRTGDERAAALAGRFAVATRAVVSAHDGTVLELRGDEALCVFSSPRQALRAAVALQRRFVEETRADPELPLPVGIGIDIGEVVAVEGGYRGGGAQPRRSAVRPGQPRRGPGDRRGRPSRAAAGGAVLRGPRRDEGQGPRRSRPAGPGRAGGR